jgi:hypothetical protein
VLAIPEERARRAQGEVDVVDAGARLAGQPGREEALPWRAPRGAYRCGTAALRRRQWDSEGLVLISYCSTNRSSRWSIMSPLTGSSRKNVEQGEPVVAERGVERRDADRADRSRNGVSPNRTAASGRADTPAPVAVWVEIPVEFRLKSEF